MNQKPDQVERLCEKFTEATGFLCSADEDLEGQIVIYTGLTLTEDGYLMDMDTGEIQLPYPA